MRPPVGFYPLDVRYRHVLAAGQVLLCTICHIETHGPVPRVDPATYNSMAEDFIREHKGCEDVQRGAA